MFSNMKLERALKRVKKAANDNNNDQQGSDEDETQSSNGEISERRTSMRSKTSNLSKCIFCDSTEGELHKVSTFPLEKKVRPCATVLNDHILLGKLSVGDMMAQDAMPQDAMPCLQLPANYVNISPVSNFLKEPKYQPKYTPKPFPPKLVMISRK